MSSKEDNDDCDTKMPPLPTTATFAAAATIAAQGEGVMGHVPRKKKPPAPTTTSFGAEIMGGSSVAAAPAAAAEAWVGSIPRKPKIPASGGDPNRRAPSQESQEVASRRVQIVSERPFVLRIQTAGMRLPLPSPTPKRNKSRIYIKNNNKRSRPEDTRPDSPLASSTKKSARQSSSGGVRRTYEELEDTDNSEDFLTPAEELDLLNKRNRRKPKKPRTADGTATADPKNATAAAAAALPSGDAATTMTLTSESLDPSSALLLPTGGIIPTIIEPPPSGVLSTLWYSKECYLHIFVMEKICGWKTRPIVQLVVAANDNNTLPDIINNNGGTSGVVDSLDDVASAAQLQQEVLAMSEFRNNVKKRMEISRINPCQCPIVMSAAATPSTNTFTQSPLFRVDGKTTTTNNKYSFYKHSPASSGTKAAAIPTREEVLLVKWRGRSHMHCSWERAADIERLDPSTNNSAKNKVRKFYQTQEIRYGLDWKKLLEDELNTAASIQTHGNNNGSSSAVVGVDGGANSMSPAPAANDVADVSDEYFSPQCLEVERILACDENETDMTVFAKQRSLNMSEEFEELSKKEEQQQPLHDCGTFNMNDRAEIWDSEDGVRYVVKWKGLPYVDMTWEYWWDIKRSAVDEVEDFWYRQQAPDVEMMRLAANRPHPQMKDFKKLQESPSYGVSKKPRPHLGGDNVVGDGVNESDPGFRLRSYQLEGLNWLLFNWWNRRSCILADEMGLGKTIQSAAFMQELQNQPAAQVRGPFLIVAPLSLIDQWQSELNSWAPDINVIVYHGSADARDFIVKHEFFYSDQFTSKGDSAKLRKLQITKFHVLITTYEVVLKDTSVLSKIRWRTLIVDEAHRLKNHKARLFDELASVPRDHCVLLTGTPIANATEELWALLHFANPRSFKDRDDFLEKFGEVTDAKQVNELHALLKPYLLRRVKEDVEKSLPNKEETILEVSLTPIQKTFYKAIYERNTTYLFKGTKPNNAPSLMNVMMELRKCCNHPFLVKGAEDRILREAASKVEELTVDQRLVPLDYTKLYGEQLVKASGKMVLMEKLLQKLFDGGHKVLIFSQMVRVLDLIEDLLRIKKYRYERLDGTTSSSSRLHAVDRFKNKAFNRFVMLLSTRAGGLGLNLTVADIVIIFDSDWNPQNDLQAMARAHRIGQTKGVKVYRFLTAKTYEMHMFHSASLKLGLERAVLSQNREQNEESDETGKTTRKSDREAQAKEIDELLKKGAYDVFRDDDDTEAEKFMESDIDQLLEHSSKTISYGATTTSSLGSGLGSFSKASFVADTDEGAKDVDLDDPDFWSKAIGFEVPSEETPDDIAAMLDDGVKRNRKQVQQYDPYAETALADQLKKDRVALEKILEKEERARLIEEKKWKKKKTKEEKSKIAHDGDPFSSNTSTVEEKGPPLPKSYLSSGHSANTTVKLPKLSKEVKHRKSKRGDRVRALFRAENEAPLIERFKQAWEIPQRNRATAATIRFGFGRFCKLRNESNLTSLPLQDLEVFVRSYLYQLSLQVAVLIMSQIRRNSTTNIHLLIQQWTSLHSPREIEWIADSIQSVLNFQSDVESDRRCLRMPLVLAEPTYVDDLRHGSGFRALRRIGILARLNGLIENCVDSIFATLGQEELGKRGCAVHELTNLDVDLKARFVTTEELTLIIGSSFQNLDLKSPVSWWDRSCDVALIIGTFIHGYGNYEGMRRDQSLPFGDKILQLCALDTSYKAAMQRFRIAADATVATYEDALEAGRLKAEAEVQAAVAAAAKAAQQREFDAALLRKGGSEAADAVRNMPETQVNDAFEFDGTDSHFVTLPRMHANIQGTIRSSTTNSPLDLSLPVDAVAVGLKAELGSEPRTTKVTTGRINEHHYLPMPDSRVLDYRLARLLSEIEGEEMNSEVDGDLWLKTADVLQSLSVRRAILPLFEKDAYDIINEYSGVGFGGNQCGISHRTLNDGSDFSFGSANHQISLLAYGTDAPRYLRALGVPMNITRFAVSGLVYAEKSCVDALMTSERLRFFGREVNDEVNTSRYQSVESGPEVDTLPNIGDSISAEERDDQTDGIPTMTLDIETSDFKMRTSSRPKVIQPVDPIELIHESFRRNAKLRATVALAVCFYGFPSPHQDSLGLDVVSFASVDLASAKQASASLFDMLKFQKAVKILDPEVDLPEVDVLRTYVDEVLLPHCLRLCVNGNGPSTRHARGSHGDYETAFGISLHPEPSQPHPSPLPDPCLSLQYHSLEALGFAHAMLRRVRLLRTCTHLCSKYSEIHPDRTLAVAQSSEMGQLNCLPVWWSPCIHDIALLIQAATGGLFSILINRWSHPVFSPKALQDHLFMRLTHENSYIKENQYTVGSQAMSWTEHNAAAFPSLYQLERRLALLCSEATSGIQSENRFDYIPMFDHGGWPRN